MYRDLRCVYWWRNMKREVADFVSICLVCQQVKAHRQRPVGLLQPLSVPGWKWESVSMDFITGLPRTLKGYTMIWVVVDRLTKSSHFILGKSTYTTKEVARGKPLCTTCGKHHLGHCLFGTNTCFKCEQDGHIANRCPEPGSISTTTGRNPPPDFLLLLLFSVKTLTPPPSFPSSSFRSRRCRQGSPPHLVVFAQAQSPSLPSLHLRKPPVAILLCASSSLAVIFPNRVSLASLRLSYVPSVSLLKPNPNHPLQL
ncbi:ty3-gypsy retrotransposon protein [Cucumis melo var. makuwa]|nr:ty3-gypsy retrotransposon protein [Cucumis melo var. makuwa]